MPLIKPKTKEVIVEVPVEVDKYKTNFRYITDLWAKSKTILTDFEPKELHMFRVADGTSEENTVTHFIWRASQGVIQCYRKYGVTDIIDKVDAVTPASGGITVKLSNTYTFEFKGNYFVYAFAEEQTDVYETIS